MTTHLEEEIYKIIADVLFSRTFGERRRDGETRSLLPYRPDRIEPALEQPYDLEPFSYREVTLGHRRRYWLEIDSVVGMSLHLPVVVEESLFSCSSRSELAMGASNPMSVVVDKLDDENRYPTTRRQNNMSDRKDQGEMTYLVHGGGIFRPLLVDFIDVVR